MSQHPLVDRGVLSIPDRAPPRLVTYQAKDPDTAINWVRLEGGLDGHDHLIDPKHLTRIAMARQ